MANGSPTAVAFLRALKPGLAATSVTDLTGLTDLAYGEEQGLTPEVGWNILGATLPLGGAAAGVLGVALHDPAARAALDAMVYGKSAKDMARHQPGSDFLNRVESGMQQRFDRLKAQGVANAKEKVYANVFRRLGLGASIGAVAGALPAIMAMTGDWGQERRS